MKKLILTSAFLATAVAVAASPLTPDEALKAALGNSQKHNAPLKNSYTLAYTGEESRAYAFNREDEGFMIVAGDTDFGTSILGYSETGRIDPFNMPDGLKWFIDAQRPSREVARSLGKPEIASLITTKWNQDSPYNNLCPQIGSTRCMTGCVATAMAQILKHWNYPATGRGTISYYWTEGNTTLSHDFTADQFDWDNMLDSYKSSSTSKQKQAVAQLMVACGMAAQMQYGVSSSGAYDTNASVGLINYLKYDISIMNAMRPFYSLNQWNQLLYNSLSKNEPVLYTGQSKAGGHAFVICGYKEMSGIDYFYVNWGWGGMSDGYFMLNFLSPDQQGIGGGLGTFSSYQSAMLNIKPAVTGSSITPNLITLGRFTASSHQVNRSNGRPGFKIVDGSNVYPGNKVLMNYSLTTLTGYLGVKLLPIEGGNPTYVALDDEQLDFRAGSGYSSFSLQASKFPKTGTYFVTPAFKCDNKWYDFRQEYLLQSIVTVECTSSTLTFNNTTSDGVVISDVNLGNRTVVKGDNLDVSATLKAGIEGFSGVVLPRVLSGNTIVAEGDQTIFNLQAEATTDYTATVDISDLKVGTYSLVFTDDSDVVLPSTPESLSFSIIEGEQEPGILSCRKVTLNGLTLKESAPVDITEKELGVTLYASAENNYDGLVYLMITGDSPEWKFESETQHVTLLDKESSRIKFSLTPDLTSETIYTLVGLDENGEISGTKGLFRYVEPAGITAVTADEVADATLYTLSGIRVTAPQSGVVYIMQRPLSRATKVIIR